MSIKTSEFVENLVYISKEDFANSNFYIFASDYEGNAVSVNSAYSKIQFLEKTLFGRKITEADVSYMIQNRFWQENVIYSQYDDRADMTDKNFYVISQVNQGGDYHIFKCLFNNGNAASTAKPTFNSSIYESGENYELIDGYIWKHMFTVTPAIAGKFGNRFLFPITVESNIQDGATDGLDVILVENPDTNFGYNKLTGTVKSRVLANRFTTTIEQSFNEIPGFYSNNAFFVEKFDNSVLIGSRQYKILFSEIKNNEYFFDLEDYNPNEFEIEVGDKVSILPRVEIYGTGSGAEAIVEFNENNTAISKIRILSKGSGYVSASAVIIDPFLTFNPEDPNTADVRCLIRPIIPPKGGHGKNPISELLSRDLSISIEFKSFNTNIPNTNFYSKMGIVKEPIITNYPDTFDNRIEIELGTGASSLSVGQVVSQVVSGVKISGIINEIANNSIFVSNYLGDYAETFSNTSFLTTTIGNININNVNYSDYEQRTGDVLYMSDFSPIERTSENTEQLKIILRY
jgi:hypothetical protein